MIMIQYPISNATNPPLPLGEGLGRRVEPVETVRSLPKRQIEVTMFVAMVGKFEGWEVSEQSIKLRWNYG
jgi:hypothetical protein